MASPEALPDINKKGSTASRILKLLAKIGITVLCFWYISTRINFNEAFDVIRKANWFLLLLALFIFVLSKFFSALRLNIYFRNIKIKLSEWANVRLYWLGMFYNLFIPGAISGDVYKVILLNRRYKTSYKKTSSAVLLDRFSGVLALAVILAVYGMTVLKNQLYYVILIAGTILAIAGFYFVVRFLFKDFISGFLSTFLWSLAVQVSQVICIYIIMKSLGIPLTQHEWIFIFLASAIITVLPISLGGGLGTRELVFVEGARSFHLDPETGVTISLIFYFVTVAGSLPGLYFVFHNPLDSNTKITNKEQGNQKEKNIR